MSRMTQQQELIPLGKNYKIAPVEPMSDNIQNCENPKIKNTTNLIFLDFETSLKIEEHFNFGAEEAADFEIWLNEFYKTLPENKKMEDYKKIFVEAVYKMNEQDLKNRLKSNHYLTYSELLSPEEKQISTFLLA